MASLDFGLGEKEFRCTAWTCVVYEQEFHSDPYEKVTGDLIADVMGKLTIRGDSAGVRLAEDGSLEIIVQDYTRDDWNVQRRALWAMLKTQDDIEVGRGLHTSTVPSYAQWCRTLLEVEPDMREVSLAIGNELQRGLFRSGAAASGKTSE